MTGAWAKNNEKHATRPGKDQNKSGNKTLASSSRFHHVHQHQEQIIPLDSLHTVRPQF